MFIIIDKFAMIQRGWVKKTFLLYKKLVGWINHHQLLNECILHNFFAFLSNIINFQEKLKRIQQTE